MPLWQWKDCPISYKGFRAKSGFGCGNFWVQRTHDGISMSAVTAVTQNRILHFVCNFYFKKFPELLTVLKR